MSNKIICAFDGGASGNPGQGGSGFVVEGNYEFIAYFEYATNNFCELYALKELLKLLNSEFKGMECIIYGDSKYVVEGTISWMHNWIKRNWEKPDGSDIPNWELWKEIYESYDANFHKLIHVKGHSGHSLNERADELTHLARSEKKTLLINIKV